MTDERESREELEKFMYLEDIYNDEQEEEIQQEPLEDFDRGWLLDEEGEDE